MDNKDLIIETHDQVLTITLNRSEKNNAFDDALLRSMLAAFLQAEEDKDIHVIILKANGSHFSAGADLAWMQRMANYSIEENINDAKVLAQLMYTIHHCKKPTIAAVQGAAYGGGAGLAAACDIVIAAHSARFCFSEVKLGLIPAVISPYVIKAIGERMAKWLFMSAELFTAAKAQDYHLVHQCVDESELHSYSLQYGQRLAAMPVEALFACKSLVNQVACKEINEELLSKTAELIAAKRISAEGQQGLRAFLEKSASK